MHAANEPAWPGKVCAAAQREAKLAGYEDQLGAKGVAQIAAQKQAWNSYCDPQRRSVIALSGLYELTEVSMQTLAGLETRINEGSPDWKNFRAWVLSAPTFLPAIKCYEDPFERLICTPDVEMFKWASKDGKPEDQVFFAQYPRLAGLEGGETTPWTQPKKTAGAVSKGCSKFGEFDWLGALAELSKLESKLQSDTYLRHVRALRQELLNDLNEPGCTCGPVEAVRPDLEKVAAGLGEADRADKDRLAKTIESIRAGRVQVQSMKSSSCGSDKPGEASFAPKN